MIFCLGRRPKGRWSYACSKALDEFLGAAYWRQKRLPVTIVRLFNTVGPRQTGRYGMVLRYLPGASPHGQAHHRLRHRRANAVLYPRDRCQPSPGQTSA